MHLYERPGQNRRQSQQCEVALKQAPARHKEGEVHEERYVRIPSLDVEFGPQTV